MRPDLSPADSDLAVLRKRLAMRSWRRGMREMDLLLGPFADKALPQMGAEALAGYASLLDTDDHEVYRWILAASAGRRAAPAEHAELVARIAAAACKRIDGI